MLANAPEGSKTVIEILENWELTVVNAPQREQVLSRISEEFSGSRTWELGTIKGRGFSGGRIWKQESSGCRLEVQGVL